MTREGKGREGSLLKTLTSCCDGEPCRSNTEQSSAVHRLPGRGLIQ